MDMDAFGLAGKVAIVTGGATGMGRATARLLHEAGATVVVTDIDPAGAATVGELGGRGHFIAHDVTSEPAWADAVTRTLQQFGAIDVLVNNAGAFQAKPIGDATMADFELMFRVNQLGVFLGMRAVADAMKGRGGSIVNIASGAALRGVPGMFAYSASKWAVRGMTRAAAHELAPHGIRVNDVCPGAIATNMIKANGDAVNQAIIAGTPLRRMGEPEEVASVVLFLCSRLASFVSGAEIVVDGALNA